MGRAEDRGVTELRERYEWLFAAWLHITPEQLDRLNWRRFYRGVAWVEAEQAARKDN